MEVKLELDRTDLLVQETTSGWIRLKNTSARPATIPDPEFSLEGPILRVTNLATGTSEDFRATTRARKMSPHFTPQPGGPPVKHFGPGEGANLFVDLLDWTGVLVAGRYSLCAVLSHGEMHFESDAIEIAVRAVEGWLETEPPSSSGEPEWCSAWAPLDDKGGSLVLVRTMQFTNFARITGTTRVHAASAPVRPVVSTPPNGGVSQGHWLAWLEKQGLFAAFEEFGDVKVKPISLKIPGRSVQLFGPVLCDEAPDETPGEGLVTLFRRDPAGTAGEIVAVRLPAKGKPEIAASVPVPAAPPLWNHAAHLSTERRFAVWTTKEGRTIRLHRVTWPRRGAPEFTRAAASFEGGWIGAAATLDFDDVLQGAMLVMAPEGEPPGACWIPWQLDAEGRCEVAEPARTEWPVEKSIAHCVLRVDAEGQPFGVLGDGEGKWHLLDSDGKVVPLPPGSPRSMPIDLVFTTAGDPIVLYTDESRGLRYVKADGSAYPAW